MDDVLFLKAVNFDFNSDAKPSLKDRLCVVFKFASNRLEALVDGDDPNMDAGWLVLASSSCFDIKDILDGDPEMLDGRNELCASLNDPFLTASDASNPLIGTLDDVATGKAVAFELLNS